MLYFSRLKFPERGRELEKGKQGITNNFLWKFAERLSAQIVSFVVSLILARLLLPEDYGAVALVLVFIEIANVFVSAGFGNALIQKKDADDVDFSSVLYFNLGFSVILYFVLFIVAPFIADFYGNEILRPVIRVFGLRIILASINSVQQAYVSKTMQFKKFFLATFIGTAISGVVGLIMAYKGFGVWALVAQYLTNTFIDTIVLAFTIKWRPKLVYSWKRVGKLLSFGWKILVEGLAETISVQIRNLIIGKVYTESDLGHYTRGQQFPQLVMTNINSSISSVLFPAMSEVQDDEEKLVFLMRKSVRVSSYILFPLLFGIAAVAENMVRVLLTDKWLPCVPFIYVACISYFITIGMYARHQALKAKGRSDVFMIEHMASRILSFVILFLVYRISVMAIALSGIAGALLLMLIIMFTSKRYTSYKYGDQIKDVAGLFVMAVIMFLPTFLIGCFMNFNPLVELIIQVATGLVIYIVLSLIFKPEGYAFVLGFLKRLFKKKKEVNA